MVLGGDPKELETLMRGLIKKRRGSPEAQIQRAVCQHLTNRAARGVVWWHTPNGGKRNIREAVNLKRMGVRAGVSDIIALHRGRMFALELKAPAGRSTIEQMEFASAVNAAGGFSCIAHGLEQAIKVLETWGLLRSDSGTSVLSTQIVESHSA